MIELDRLGHPDQAVLVTERPAIDVRVARGLSLRINPQRGLDIGAAWFRGVPIAWVGPAGEGGTDAADWHKAWGGGLVTTCGLDNVGAPSEGIGLHGTYTFLAAHDVVYERSPSGVTVTATIDDPRGLRAERAISVEGGSVELADRTTNVSDVRLAAPLLYHVNFGWPLWDAGATVETDADEVRPRDEDAAPHDPSPAPPEPAALPERVWEHVGATRAGVTNEALGIAVQLEFDLPKLWQWVDPAPGVYALSLEPANCSVLGRAHDRAEGTLPFLDPGDERTTRIAVTAKEVE
ncbi:MAG TPA: DUF4432 family protein [Gaiellaceae bacterium]|nr:DUF4432 family protein [Gaiellaceae bacterium]